MPDFLQLPHLRTLSVQDAGDHYEVLVEGAVIPTTCPVCQSGLYGHGSQRQMYLDTPSHGKRVVILIDRKRFRCRGCGKTLFEPLAMMDSKRLTTSRLVQHVERHCLRKTFAELSREVGVDDKTIRHIFDDYVEGLKQTVTFETPEILGIDELKIVGQYRCMLTNVQKLSLFDMLATRNKGDLLTYFSKMPRKEQVKALTMDLWSVYRQVAEAQFPGRMIVADRFHVVRMANEGIEKVRKVLRKDLPTKERLRLKDDRFILLARRYNLGPDAQEKLASWSEEYPMLGAAYEAKEAFHEIYAHPTKADAMRAAEEWLGSMPGHIEWAFKDMMGSLRNWWGPIFNYYDLPITNGYTESINNIAKGMNRMGRGYSFDVIRARLLFDDEARKDTRISVRKKIRKRVEDSLMGFATTNATPSIVRYEDVWEERVIEYGPYIPTLARKLEAGDFS